jgi:hypothetical protein
VQAGSGLDFTPAVTVNNPFGEGKIEVDDLDFTTKPAGGPARAKAGAPDSDLPAELVVGTWVDIRDKDNHRPAKLSFVSPLKTRYLFMNRQGKITLECSRAELVRRFRLGEITITAETASEAPLFDRLMGGLVNKLGGPAGKG